MADYDKYFPYENAIDARRGEPKPKRTCTNFSCAVCFSVLSGLAIFLAFILPVIPSIPYVCPICGTGDIHRLNHGMDYKGDLCGFGVNAANKYLMYCGSKEKQQSDPDLPQSLHFSSKTCVPSCPTSSTPIPLNQTNPIQCLRKAYYHVNTSVPNPDASGVMQLDSFGLDIWQTVENGDPYPTEPLYDMYCVPKQQWLRDSLLYGPLQREPIMMKWVASFRHAWPIILLAALLSCLLGIGYLLILSQHAGPLIACSFCVTIFFSIVLGLLFSVALFAPPSDGTSNENWYTHFNPIVHSVFGWNGKLLSMFVGFCFLLFGVGLYFAAMNTMEQIDRAIAPIWVSIECIFQSVLTCDTSSGKPVWKKKACAPSCVVIEVFFKVFWLLLLLAFCLTGLGMISTVGYLDRTNIVYNDALIEGLEAKFVWYPFWEWVVGFYFCMCIWWMEILLGTFQFSIIYAVTHWYFIKKEDSSVPGPTMNMSSGVSKVSMRLGGVDNVAGERQGLRVKSTAGGPDFIITQVGKKGPGGKDMIANVPLSIQMAPTGTKVKPWGDYNCACFWGNWYALRYHLGTIATAVWYTVPSRIPLNIAMCIRSLVPLETQNKRGNFEEEGADAKGAFYSLLLLIAHQLEHGFGGFTKNLYCSLTLRSCDFKEASEKSREMIEEAGGLVAFLHGSTALYEILGTIFIAMSGGFFTLCFIHRGWLCLGEVQDAFAMTFTATAICGMIGYFFMSLFNITVDTILYTFTWAREMGYNDSKVKDNIGKMCCPQVLEDYLKNEFENTNDFNGPHNVGQVGMQHNTFANHHVHASIKSLTKTAFGTKTETKPLLGSSV